jgi:hypothetical protein
MESVRDLLVTSLKTELGETVQVIREGADFNNNFPLVVVHFMGASIHRHGYGPSKTVTGDRDNWTMEEPVRIYLYTLENIDGEDTSREQLQDLVDQVEYYIRNNWNGILKPYQCAVWFPSSYTTSTRRTYYGENGLNEATIRLGMQEPRYPVDATAVPGPDAEKVLLTSKEMTAGEVKITIED